MRRLVRYGLLSLNAAILLIVGFFVWHSTQQSSSPNTQVVANAAATSNSSIAADPLDQLSSADIAVNIAHMANLPEATAVTNQADSENAQMALLQSSDSLVAKPQIVASAFKSNKDIQLYTTIAGDTVAKIASRFNVTSNSIMWSNDLSGNDVTAGQKLYIPPVNGIVYVVKSGDTASSLAQKYHTTQAKIVAYNDAEIAGIYTGERIIIPDGQESTAGSSTVSSGAYSSAGFLWGTGPIYGSNGYDPGYCTWYVASKISVPTNWGNASSWAYYAALSGWTVSSVPVKGAIAQTPYAAGGEGHVAIVEAVSADGSQIKFSDMNGLAGWGQVGYSGWVPASTFPNYIYH